MVKKVNMVLMVSFAMVSFLYVANAQATDGGYRIFKPDKPGPHPAVIFVSGCSGFKPDFAPKKYERKAAQLRALGFVVVWADYLGRRNLESCAGDLVSLSPSRKQVVMLLLPRHGFVRSHMLTQTASLLWDGLMEVGAC